MEQLVQASQALDAASHWSVQAEIVDACNAETPFEERPSLEQVATLLLADVTVSREFPAQVLEVLFILTYSSRNGDSYGLL